MNYLKLYIKICKNALKRNNLDCYVEYHHIFPKSIYGKNKNVVALTAKEHFIVHFLLFKLCKKRYGLNHWKTRKMGYAFKKMTCCSKTQKRYYSRIYEFFRKWFSENNPLKYRNSTGSNNSCYGMLWMTNGTENKMIKTEDFDFCKKLGFYKGRYISSEIKEKIKTSIKGKIIISEEQRRKISETLKGRKLTEVTKKKISNASLGRKLSQETINTLSINRIGKGNPCFGKICVNDGIKNKFVLKEELNIYLENGYKKGKIINKKEDI